MGRYARITYPNLTYHVINRGNNRDVIFVEPEDYTHYLNTIQRYKKKYNFQLFAYCIMMNHVHMLIKVSEEGSISRIMQSITIAHIRWYNYKYQRCGHVWQGRFYSPIVSEDDHMLRVMQYIEQNPLRTKMVNHIKDYQWSSYCLNIRKKESILIDRMYNKVFNELGESISDKIRAYKKLMTEEIDSKQLLEIRESTWKESNYISEKFQNQILELLPKKRRPGRHKKQVGNYLK